MCARIHSSSLHQTCGMRLLWQTQGPNGASPVSLLLCKCSCEKLRSLGTCRYKPRKGDALLFWTTYPNGEIDAHALHGGCPVVKGEKWVATKWLRNKKLFSDTAAELEHALDAKAKGEA